MSLGAPLGLLALLAVPVVLVLHLFRRRLPVRRVAGLFLWAPEGLAARAGRKRSRLLRTASLALELLAAIAAALWLAGLQLGIPDAGRHLVLVLDDSASMQARHEDGQRAVELARRAARTAVDALSRDASVTVIRTGARPTVVLGPGALRGSAAQSIAEWEPGAVQHDFGPALDLAVELAGAAGDVLFLTDAPLGERAPPRVTVRAFGVARANVAILTARRAATSTGDERLLLDVQLHAPTDRVAPTQARAVLRAAGDPFAPLVAELALDPARPARLALDAPRSDAVWDVTIEAAGDALDVDDRAVLLPDPMRVVTFASALDAELTARLELERVARALDGVVLVGDVAAAQVCFVTAAGDVGPGRHQVVVAPVGAGEHDAWIGPFLIERRHPLGAGLTLDGVVWTAGRGEVSGAAIALAGRQVLLAEERDASGGLRLRVNLDPARSNLTSSPDWPILLDNLARRVRELAPGPGAVNVAVGDALGWRPAGAADAPAELELVDPVGRVLPARGTTLAAWEADQVGVYALRTRAGVELGRFGVSFRDPAESDLAACASGEQAAAEPPTAPDGGDERFGRRGSGERRGLALLLLALLAADWWVLREQRRR
ncbi:MAG: VWA domain-containing protein [Planctomycetes bacterium]|nr:VWA domain-containing protein [Planctomycetota bacterium]